MTTRPPPNRYRAQYFLTNGYALDLPAKLWVGDEIGIDQPRRGVLGWFLPRRHHRATVKLTDARDNVMPLMEAFAMVSDALLTPECKGVVMRANGELVIGLDSRLYGELKQTLGYGHTRLPLDPDEAFQHGRFVFCIVASHAWQRGREPGQALS